MAEEKQKQVSLKEVESELESLKIEDAELMKKLEKESLVDEEKMKRLIKLISSDEKEFLVEARVAFQSEMIQNAIEDCEHDSVALPNVDAEILEKILHYCTKHAEKGVLDKNLEEFDQEYLDVSMSLLYDLLMAANYLSIKALVTTICKKVARMIKGKTVEEIREIFDIENDFPPGKEEEIRSENRWAFEPRPVYNNDISTDSSAGASSSFAMENEDENEDKNDDDDEDEDDDDENDDESEEDDEDEDEDDDDDDEDDDDENDDEDDDDENDDDESEDEDAV